MGGTHPEASLRPIDKGKRYLTRGALWGLTKASPKSAALLRMRASLREVIPEDLTALDDSRFVPEDLIAHSGIELSIEDQLARLARWGKSLGPLLHQLREDPAINTRYLGKPYLHNGHYPTPDAEVYAALISDYKPSTIVEVGAGYSTLIARKVVASLGLPTRIVVIDPEPRTDVANYADEIIYRRVESLPTHAVPVEERDILFIDTSHITRAGGDVPYLFNRLVPTLPSGVLVYVHDIFLPYDYPAAYRKRLYTEQYVLHALLSGATRYRTVFATHYMIRWHREEMRRTFGMICGANELFYGASYWFEVE
jgi:hypothetical protein